MKSHTPRSKILLFIFLTALFLLLGSATIEVEANTSQLNVQHLSKTDTCLAYYL